MIATFISSSPLVWQRERQRLLRRRRRLAHAQQRGDRAEPEIGEQRPQSILRFVQVAVVTEAPEPARLQPWLLGIDFPRMDVKHGRLMLHRVQACDRSEEHTSELQSQSNLVCRLLLEK